MNPVGRTGGTRQSEPANRFGHTVSANDARDSFRQLVAVSLVQFFRSIVLQFHLVSVSRCIRRQKRDRARSYKDRGGMTNCTNTLQA